MVLMFIGGIADAQDPFLEVVGSEGFDGGVSVGAEVTVIFQAGFDGIGQAGIPLDMTATPNINVTSHTMPGTYNTSIGGLLIVTGRLTETNGLTEIRAAWMIERQKLDTAVAIELRTIGQITIAQDPSLEVVGSEGFEASDTSSDVSVVFQAGFEGVGQASIPLDMTATNVTDIVINGSPATVPGTYNTGVGGLLTVTGRLTEANGLAEIRAAWRVGHRKLDTAVAIELEANCEPGAPAAATTLTIVSGFGQHGIPGSRLQNPFVVEVRDQYGKPFSGATVNFRVAIGKGRLSRTTARTNDAGRASVTLTLGSAAGENRVVASVSGISLPQTFTATAIATDEPSKPTTLTIVSGFGQHGIPGSRLQEPFVVEVRDQYGKPFSGATINFRVAIGKGRLSRTTARTNDAGRASVTLTLGAEAGENQVVASVSGISLPQTFTATAIATDEPPKPTTLTIVSGFGQQDEPGNRLQNPFVVEVRDQYGKPFSGATVNFTVKEGKGRLSRTAARTNSAGRASVTLTLGAEAGENSVVASVSGISLPQTFTATAIATDEPPKPTTLTIVSGNDQQGQIGSNLPSPFEIEVRDQYGDPFPGATVNFEVEKGDGRLSRTTEHTNRAGQALVTLTLGSETGENRVVARVNGISQTFTATTAVPKQTALLVNYPNPFNPETWIPYQLSEALDVTVSIYAVDGKLVRTLALGHQPAGLYQRKNRAAYWDGRNTFGERVVSGLYFYTLTAGDFTATRKMLIRK